MIFLTSFAEFITWVERLELSGDFVGYNNFELLDLLKVISRGDFNKLRDYVAGLCLCGKYYYDNEGLNHPEYLYVTELEVENNKISGNVNYRDRVFAVSMIY